MRAARLEHLLWAIHYLKKYTKESKMVDNVDAMKLHFVNGQQQFSTALMGWKMKLYIPNMFWQFSLLSFANLFV